MFIFLLQSNSWRTSKSRLSGTNIIFFKGPLKKPYLFYILTGYCGPVTEHPVLFKIHPIMEYLSSEEALLKSANHHDNILMRSAPRTKTTGAEAGIKNPTKLGNGFLFQQIKNIQTGISKSAAPCIQHCDMLVVQL